MFSFFKKQNQVLAERPTHSELGDTEQRTPKAGYLLLLVMVIASLMFGWRALDDVSNVPLRPQILSQCANEFLFVDWEDVGRFSYYQYAEPAYFDDSFPASYDRSLASLNGLNGPYYPRKEKSQCAFSALEVKYGIPKAYEKRYAINLNLQNLQLELQQTDNSIVDFERQYNLGLQEKIAEEQRRLYPIGAIQQQLEPLRKKKAELEIQIDRLRGEMRPFDDGLKAQYAKLIPEFRNQWRWYEFKVFLLQVVFVAPFFLFVFFAYRRLLLRKSPYAIIFTALLFVASVFALRIFIAWFWNLFLARVIQALWTFIQSVALLKSLVFYGGMLASIVVFGGAVYLLQKHIFDPKRTALRALKHNKCPQCEFSLDMSVEFCPNCSRRIRKKCVKCGNMRFVDFLTCPHCGSSPLAEKNRPTD